MTDKLVVAFIVITLQVVWAVLVRTFPRSWEPYF